MRYHHKKPDNFEVTYGEVYSCDHMVYSRCTLYKDGSRGLAIIQQRFDTVRKITWWSEIDSYLRDEIYLSPLFQLYFDKYATKPDRNGLYFTVTVRQIMWALKLKPLPKEDWETTFDRRGV